MERPKNLPYLSECAQVAFLEDKKGNNPLTLVEENEALIPATPTFVIDICFHPGFLKRWFSSKKYFDPPPVLFVIFTDVRVVKDLLSAPFLEEYFKRKQIRLWWCEEWEKMLGDEFENPRSAILHCSRFLSAPDHPLRNPVIQRIGEKGNEHKKDMERWKKEVEEYYKSDTYLEQKKTFLEGRKPKVYVDRVCTSVAVKRFSDACVKTFRELGCEVKTHSPCEESGDYDSLSARDYEIKKFRPDFYLISPNNWDTHKNLPTLISLQDCQPHLDYLEILKDSKIGEEDCLFFLESGYSQEFLEKGVKEEQLISHFLPAEPSQLEGEGIEPLYDVGYVKTLGSDHDLLSYLNSRFNRDLYPDELERIKKIDEFLNTQWGQLPFASYSMCLSLVNPFSWGTELTTFIHQESSIALMKDLAKKGYSMGLTGNGWTQYEDLAPFALGHVEDRRQYQERFMLNKVNISFHPWASYHPRVFEGGACGAFFLVHLPPEGSPYSRLTEDFIPGEHLDYFSSMEELEQKLEYYLDRPEKRRAIGKNLKKLLEEKYSYKEFCSGLIERFRSNLSGCKAG